LRKEKSLKSKENERFWKPQSWREGYTTTMSGKFSSWTRKRDNGNDK